MSGTAGSNSTLTDDEQKALFFQHRKSYQTALAAKKKADAALLDTAKKAKAELSKNAVHMIKTAIELESDEGSEKLKERIERELQVARWLGLPVGAQGSLFEPDRRTADEIANQEGCCCGCRGRDDEDPGSLCAILARRPGMGQGLARRPGEHLQHRREARRAVLDARQERHLDLR